MSEKPTNKTVTAICRGCREEFTYEVKLKQVGWKKKTLQYAFRQVCDKCRKLKAEQVKKAYDKRRVCAVQGKKWYGEENVLRSTREEVAERLGMTERAVREAEGKILNTIRNNGELMELWAKVKEEGLPPSLELFSEGDVNLDTLLDYQMSVLDWWALYETVFTAGISEEAATVLIEIRQFQNVMAKCISELYVADHRKHGGTPEK